MKYIIDTHALIWHLEDDKKLGKHAGKILLDPKSKIICPSIVLAEILYLLKKGRISGNFDEIMETMAADLRFRIYPLDEDVVRNIPTKLEMHDGIIVATSIVYEKVANDDMAILTKDEAISKLGGIKTIW